MQVFVFGKTKTFLRLSVIIEMRGNRHQVGYELAVRERYTKPWSPDSETSARQMRRHAEQSHLKTEGRGASPVAMLSCQVADLTRTQTILRKVGMHRKLVKSTPFG